MKLKIFVSILILLLSNSVYSQKLYINSHYGCNVTHGEQLSKMTIMEPSEAAQTLLKKIAKATGLSSNSVILKASGDVNKARAVLDGMDRYIIINEIDIAESEDDEENKWLLYFMIAHEFAHHALGHTLDSLGSQHSYELDADYYAAFALKCLGATREQTLAITDFLEEEETSTHPARRNRRQKIFIGWKEGHNCEKEEKTTVQAVDSIFHGCQRKFEGGEQKGLFHYVNNSTYDVKVAYKLDTEYAKYAEYAGLFILWGRTPPKGEFIVPTGQTKTFEAPTILQYSFTTYRIMRNGEESKVEEVPYVTNLIKLLTCYSTTLTLNY